VDACARDVYVCVLHSFYMCMHTYVYIYIYTCIHVVKRRTCILGGMYKHIYGTCKLLKLNAFYYIGM